MLLTWINGGDLDLMKMLLYFMEIIVLIIMLVIKHMISKNNLN